MSVKSPKTKIKEQVVTRPTEAEAIKPKGVNRYASETYSPGVTDFLRAKREKGIERYKRMAKQDTIANHEHIDAIPEYVSESPAGHDPMIGMGVLQAITLDLFSESWQKVTEDGDSFLGHDHVGSVGRKFEQKPTFMQGDNGKWERMGQAYVPHTSAFTEDVYTWLDRKTRLGYTFLEIACEIRERFPELF